MDIMSHTDAFCVVFVNDPRTGQLTKVNHTSVIKESENPVWPDSIVMDYQFEITQNITVKVYDKDGKYDQTQHDKHQFIGEATFTMASLMCSPGQKLRSTLVHGRARGTLDVRGEPVANTRDVFVATFAGHKLVNKDGFFGRSDPFLTISRINEDGSYTECYKNDKIDNNLNPVWPVSRINIVQLCNGDIDRPLKISVWDYESSGKHKPMGNVMTSVRGLLDSRGAALNVIEPEKQSTRGYVNSGTLTVSNAFVEPHPTFQQFIVGGCELSMVVAIDFTGSNGDPMSPSSLHYIDRSGTGRLNQYQHAILSVGRIIEEYDTNKMFSVFGFGARVRMPDGQFTPVQHCFPVYGGGVEVQGTDGVLRAYSDALSNVALSGPTLFAPLIQASTAIAANSQCSQQNQKYTVLLIMTDGLINDMESTIASLVTASTQPMSILIIGVGNENFSGMKVLDGDGARLRSGANVATRDIVQFVPFSEYVAKGPQALAEDLLKEIPGQLLEFMAHRNIQPNPPRPGVFAPPPL